MITYLDLRLVVDTIWGSRGDLLKWPIVNCSEGTSSTTQQLSDLAGRTRDLQSLVKFEMTSGHIAEFLLLQRAEKLWEAKACSCISWPACSTVLDANVTSELLYDSCSLDWTWSIPGSGKSCCNSLRRSRTQVGITLLLLVILWLELWSNLQQLLVVRVMTFSFIKVEESAEPRAAAVLSDSMPAEFANGRILVSLDSRLGLVMSVLDTPFLPRVVMRVLRRCCKVIDSFFPLRTLVPFCTLAGALQLPWCSMKLSTLLHPSRWISINL
jgi:hypothetical protein